MLEHTNQRLWLLPGENHLHQLIATLTLTMVGIEPRPPSQQASAISIPPLPLWPPGSGCKHASPHHSWKTNLAFASWSFTDPIGWKVFLLKWGENFILIHLESHQSHFISKVSTDRHRWDLVEKPCNNQIQVRFEWKILESTSIKKLQQWNQYFRNSKQLLMPLRPKFIWC